MPTAISLMKSESKSKLARAKLVMRNEVSMVTFKLPIRKEEMQKLISVVHEPNPKLLIIIHGIDSLSFIMETGDLKPMIEASRREDIKLYRNGLATIHVTTPESLHGTRGIIAFIGAVMAANGVSIVAAEFSEDEMAIVLDKHDAPQAYTYLMDAIDGLKKEIMA